MIKLLHHSLVKAVILSALLCASSVAAVYFTPKRYMADESGNLDLSLYGPSRIGQWAEDKNERVVVADPTQSTLLDKIYSSTLSKSYVNPDGRRIMLSIAYGRDQSEALQVHTPEFCYPAQGFVIGESTSKFIDLGSKRQPVVQLVAKAAGRIEPITYWVVVGRQVVNDGPAARRNARFEYGFKGFVPDGVFFRVSSIGADEKSEYELQRKFLESYIAQLPPDVRGRLLGA